MLKSGQKEAKEYVITNEINKLSPDEIDNLYRAISNLTFCTRESTVTDDEYLYKTREILSPLIFKIKLNKNLGQ